MAPGAQPGPSLPPPEPRQQGFWGLLRSRIDWKISLGAIIAVLWLLLKWLNPLGELDLTVWVQQQIPITLPPQVNALPVKLTYNGVLINRATVLQVSIINTGAKPLGEAGAWTLVLKTHDGSRLVGLGRPTTQPDGIPVDISDGPSPDKVTVSMGLLNRKDQISFRLMIIDPTQDSHLPIGAGNPRIPHLSEPTVTSQPLSSRLADEIVGPVFLVLAPAVWLGFLLYGAKTGELTASISSGIAVVLGSLFFATMIGMGSAWLLGWIGAQILLAAAK
jgi:hypothetical protein